MLLNNWMHCIQQAQAWASSNESQNYTRWLRFPQWGQQRIMKLFINPTVGLRNAALYCDYEAMVRKVAARLWDVESSHPSAVAASWQLQGYRGIWECGCRKIPIPWPDFLRKISQSCRSMAFVLLLPSKSQAGTSILAESYLRSSPTCKTASAIWRVWVLIHCIQHSKGHWFHILGMSSISLSCRYDTKGGLIIMFYETSVCQCN